MPDERIIVIGGMPRCGKTSLSEGLSARISIAFPPTEFSFFRYFDEDKFTSRGGFEENLEFFFDKCPKSRQWNLARDRIRAKGVSAKDLYGILLQSFRESYAPDTLYVGELTPFSEQHFHTLLTWFGEERVRMIQIVRNPYLNFASYKKKNMRAGNSGMYREKLLLTFCYSWAQSVAYGYFLARRYPQSFTSVYFDEYLKDSDSSLDALVQWLGINDAPGVPDRNRTGIAYNDEESRNLMDLLSPHEKRVIDEMTCPNFLDCTPYSDGPLFLDFKDLPRGPAKRHLLSKSLLISRMGLMIEDNSITDIIKSGYQYQVQLLGVLGKKLFSKISRT